MLPGSGSYPRWKGLGFGAEGASGVSRVIKKKETGSYQSWFLPRVGGFRVWDVMVFYVSTVSTIIVNMFR